MDLIMKLVENHADNYEKSMKFRKISHNFLIQKFKLK